MSAFNTGDPTPGFQVPVFLGIRRGEAGGGGLVKATIAGPLALSSFGTQPQWPAYVPGLPALILAGAGADLHRDLPVIASTDRKLCSETPIADAGFDCSVRLSITDLLSHKVWGPVPSRSRDCQLTS